MAASKFATTPSFIGPYLALRTDSSDRLVDFVNIISFQANIRNRYTVKQLTEHTTYVQNFVGSLCRFIGEEIPALRISEIVRRGSYYDNAKLISPDEYDFMPILALSYDDAVNVGKVPKNCPQADKGVGIISIRPDDLEVKFLRKSWAKDKSGNCWLDLNLLIVLRNLTRMYVMRHTKFNEDLFNDPEAVYNEGETSMNLAPHGTCVMLRIWAPLCTTDIDLSFCIEKRDQSNGRRVMVADCMLGGCCGMSRISDKGLCILDHWTESVVDIPTEQHEYILNTMHKKLFVTLKFLSYLHEKLISFLNLDSGTIYTFQELSSYVLKMILLHHQYGCQSANIGTCLENVIEVYFNKSTSEDNPDTIIYSKKGDQEVKNITDIFFPNRTLLEVGSELQTIEFVLLLWFLCHVKHSENTIWWNELFDKDFPNNIQQEDTLHSLLNTIKWVSKLQDHSKNAPKVDSHYTWIHDSGIRTVIVLSD